LCNSTAIVAITRTLSSRATIAAATSRRASRHDRSNGPEPFRPPVQRAGVPRGTGPDTGKALPASGFRLRQGLSPLRRYACQHGEEIIVGLLASPRRPGRPLHGRGRKRGSAPALASIVLTRAQAFPSTASSRLSWPHRAPAHPMLVLGSSPLSSWRSLPIMTSGCALGDASELGAAVAPSAHPPARSRTHLWRPSLRPGAQRRSIACMIDGTPAMTDHVADPEAGRVDICSQRGRAGRDARHAQPRPPFICVPAWHSAPA